MREENSESGIGGKKMTEFEKVLKQLDEILRQIAEINKALSEASE
jgi:hypothetical protein